MPMPLWWGHVNKKVFNPLEIKRGDRPVLTHVGRSSGTTYRTPLDAHQVDNGYVFILVYGSRSDWVKNVMASRSAELTIDGDEVKLGSPRLLTAEEAWQRLPETVKQPPSFLKIDEYLLMELAEENQERPAREDGTWRTRRSARSKTCWR